MHAVRRRSNHHLQERDELQVAGASVQLEHVGERVNPHRQAEPDRALPQRPHDHVLLVAEEHVERAREPVRRDPNRNSAPTIATRIATRQPGQRRDPALLARQEGRGDRNPQQYGERRGRTRPTSATACRRSRHDPTPTRTAISMRPARRGPGTPSSCARAATTQATCATGEKRPTACGAARHRRATIPGRWRRRQRGAGVARRHHQAVVVVRARNPTPRRNPSSRRRIPTPSLRAAASRSLHGATQTRRCRRPRRRTPSPAPSTASSLRPRDRRRRNAIVERRDDDTSTTSPARRDSAASTSA